tara:strand:- start:750 stop:2153 length:1404 start_codon:yes stop_codon:yes gene_type:complete
MEKKVGLSSHGLSVFEVWNQQHKFGLDSEEKSLVSRKKYLKTLLETIKNNENLLLECLNQDLGKGKVAAYASELGFLYTEIRYALKNLKTWMSPKKVKTPLVAFPGKSQIIPEPIGKVLIIAPWNYPLQLLLSPAVGALAAGNSVVLKPSELAPRTSKVVGEIIANSFSPNIISVFEGGVKPVEELLKYRWDHIFFTGSPKVAKIISKVAAQNLTPVTLELGGKSPCIITKNASLSIAARRVCFGKWFNAGQTCVAPDYILVDESVKEIFLKSLKQEIKNIFGEKPRKSLEYARIVNSYHFDRLEGLIDSHKVCFGGDRDKSVFYIGPTLLNEVTWDSVVMKEEIFGPILPILTFTDLSCLIETLQNQEKPLALYLFSEEEVEKKLVTSNLSFGGGCINDTLLHVSNIHLPFGGVGQSGQGSYRGEKTFDLFSHKKSILTTPTRLDLPLRYPPYNKIQEKIIKFFMK